MKLLKVVDIEDAHSVLFECLEDFEDSTIELDISDSLGKIVGEDLYANEDIPSFRRSTVDGYAVVATDLAAASESVPVFLDYVGSVDMGESPGTPVASGKCVYIPTGGAIPDGADAMVMIEHTNKIGDSRIAAEQSVAKGASIINIGEDVTKGSPLVKQGTLITPQIIGVLSASGHPKVNVSKPLRIGIISTGDELVPTDIEPNIGQIRDVNTYSITAQAMKNGYEVVEHIVLKDQRDLILDTVNRLKDTADIICVSGGSSKGEKDYTASVIDEVGNPGTIIHGIAVKPGKPTIIGYDKESKTIMAGLPGHPVSAFIIFELLFGALARKYSGSQIAHPYYAKISQNLAASPGRTTCIPVKLIPDTNGYVAEPVFGKSGLISTLSRADGYITIEKNNEGLKEGEIVAVHMI